MSPALCFRILQHLEELGLLRKGQDKVLDPMAGTGITNICAGAMGYSSISVELEEKFVNFEKQNKEYAEKKLFKSLDWEMIQGDSRKLSELLLDNELKSVMSPPFAGQNQRDIAVEGYGSQVIGGLKRNIRQTQPYSETEGQIGNLKDTPLKSIVSPPYEQSITSGKGGIEWQEEWGKPSESRQPSQNISYGDSKENIGNLKDMPLKSVMSPPYLDALNPPHDVGLEAKRLEIARQKGISPDKVSHLDYTKKGGSLKSVTSPPYGDAEKRDRSVEASNEKEKDYPRGDLNISTGYQGSDENIGKLDDKPLKSIVSPPYGGIKENTTCDTVMPANSGAGDHRLGRKGTKWEFTNQETRKVGENSDNIGLLDDKPLKSVMSPPYDNRMRNEGNPSDAKHRIWPHGAEKYDATYPTSEGQIGNEKSESYLEAMTRVYFEIASVSDCLTIVIKNPTRAGKLRRLDLDTIKILEMSGWRIHCQHRALLFEELEQGVMIGETDMLVPDLSRAVEQPRFGYRMVITPAEDDEDYKEFVLEYPKLKPNTTYYAPQVPSGTIGIDGKRVKGRLSFFKRLSYIKGQPVASWEDILICVRK